MQKRQFTRAEGSRVADMQAPPVIRRREISHARIVSVTIFVEPQFDQDPYYVTIASSGT